MERGRAVILKQHNAPMVIEEFDVPDPEPGAIVIKMTQAGLCGSDLHAWRGGTALQTLPARGRVMGHEGNGVVYRLGQGVTSDSLGNPIREGDRVVHSAVMPCYHCYYCQRGEYNWCPAYPSNREAGVFPYFVGTFADFYYLPPRQPIYRVPDRVPESVLSYLNCALGTVTEGLMRAEAGPGKTVVLQGAGGLGLGAAAIAKQLGVDQVIIMDRQPRRLELAIAMGADVALNIDEYDTPAARLEQVRQRTGGRGADIVMELVGNARLMEEGLNLLASGGTFVQIGAVPPGDVASISPASLLRGKRIIGSLMYRPQVLPVLLGILERSRDKVPFDRLISRSYPIERVNEAFHDVEWHGRTTDITRAVIVP
jgi:threonine dehydrogenase-like Zn-dependent dehydrogenase